jgi:hypothetical protein
MSENEAYVLVFLRFFATFAIDESLSGKGKGNMEWYNNIKI